MRIMPIRSLLLLLCLRAAVAPEHGHARLPSRWLRGRGEHRFLYVAEPGIRNYVEHGGIGVLVFDIDNGASLRPAHPHDDRAGRGGAGEREGHRRQRRDRAART